MVVNGCKKWTLQTCRHTHSDICSLSLFSHAHTHTRALSISVTLTHSIARLCGAAVQMVSWSRCREGHVHSASLGFLAVSLPLSRSLLLVLRPYTRSLIGLLRSQVSGQRRPCWRVIGWCRRVPLRLMVRSQTLWFPGRSFGLLMILIVLDGLTLNCSVSCRGDLKGKFS